MGNKTDVCPPPISRVVFSLSEWSGAASGRLCGRRGRTAVHIRRLESLQVHLLHTETMWWPFQKVNRQVLIIQFFPKRKEDTIQREKIKTALDQKKICYERLIKVLSSLVQ